MNRFEICRLVIGPSFRVSTAIWFSLQALLRATFSFYVKCLLTNCRYWSSIDLMIAAYPIAGYRAMPATIQCRSLAKAKLSPILMTPPTHSTAIRKLIRVTGRTTVHKTTEKTASPDRLQITLLIRRDLASGSSTVSNDVGRERTRMHSTKVKMPAKKEMARKSTKLRMLRRPTQLLRATQWWSKPCTQFPHAPQWDALLGRVCWQVSQLRFL